MKNSGNFKGAWTNNNSIITFQAREISSPLAREFVIMNKKYLKLALIGLAAGFCLSAQTAPANQDEVAMAKCSKDSSGNMQRQRGCGSQDNDDENQSCTSTTCKPKNAKNQKKSAAQKVVQGS